jgi:hypothetical protein
MLHAKIHIFDGTTPLYWQKVHLKAKEIPIGV